MKDVYFQMLDFGGKIREIDEFHDFGYVSNLLDKTKELFARSGESNSEEYIEKCGLNINALKTKLGGVALQIKDYPILGSKTAWIYYKKFNDESIDIWNRAHEESHAICHLGLRGELEKIIGLQDLSSFCEEDFCNRVGLYVLKRKGIQISPNILITYEDPNAFKDMLLDKKFKPTEGF